MNSAIPITPGLTHKLQNWAAHAAGAVAIISSCVLMGLSFLYTIDIAPLYKEGIRYSEGKGPAYSYASTHWSRCSSLFKSPASCAEKTINEVKAEQGDKFKQDVEDAIADIMKHSMSWNAKRY